jgi:hypothetical protein
MIIRDGKTVYELLIEMWFKTPSVVKIFPENFLPLNTNMIASDCRCADSEPHALVKVMEQIKEEYRQIQKERSLIKMAIFIYDTWSERVLMEDMGIFHDFLKECSEIRPEWGIGVWKSDEVRVVAVYYYQSNKNENKYE